MHFQANGKKMTPKQLKKLRIKLGHSTSSAATQVHVDRRSWQRYESGASPISETTLHLFCLLNGVEYKPEMNDKLVHIGGGQMCYGGGVNYKPVKPVSFVSSVGVNVPTSTEYVINGRRFKVTKGCIRPDIDGCAYQADKCDAPDEGWEKCEEITDD